MNHLVFVDGLVWPRFAAIGLLTVLVLVPFAGRICSQLCKKVFKICMLRSCIDFWGMCLGSFTDGGTMSRF